MSYLRTASTRRLLAIIAGVLIVIGGGTAIAVAAAGSGPVPGPKALPQAIHDALAAPQVPGITARITFTNHLISSSDIQGSDPVLNGATGRLWLDPTGHRLRLELQGDNGDAQVVVNGRSGFLSDPSMHTVYKFTLPAPGAATKPAAAERVPSVATIQQDLTKLAQHLDISGARPSDVAHQAAYTVAVSPQHAGGLLGSAQLAWDAVRGVPLRFAIYAHGNSDPVLQLKVDKISYSSISSSVFQIPAPSGDKVVTVARATAGAADAKAHKALKARKGHHALVNGTAAVARRLPFALVAPAQLVGLPRHSVTLLDWGGHPAALVTYGQNLGGIAVIEQRAVTQTQTPAASGGRDRPGLSLPTVSINGATGQELDTALGTVVRFTRGGVSYTVIGSVPATAADAAARAM